MLVFIVLLTILALWGLWALHAVVSPHVLPFINERLGVQWSWTLEQSGQWGDTFGALNTLFASLGFVAVLMTLRQQQRQIKAAQEDQHRQRFESSYFELLRLFREAKKDLRFIHTKDYYIDHPLALRDVHLGVNVFRAAWKEFAHRAMKEPSFPTRGEAANIYHKAVHNRYESSLGPYFRLLYTMLYRIKNDPILTSEEKNKYGNLLRSQLSSYEIAVIGLNGLSIVSKDFDELLVEFRMLKYVPKGPRREILSKYYPAQAFAPRD